MKSYAKVLKAILLCFIALPVIISSGSCDKVQSESRSENSSLENSSLDHISSSDVNSDITSQAVPSSSVVTNPKSNDFIIAEKGVPKATIVIPKSASDKVNAAAEDLQSHLNRITGGTFDIAGDNIDTEKGNYILVGPTAQTHKLKIKQPSGYPGVERVIIKRINNYIVLTGNDDGNYHGTEFAVNMFLEELGCAWFAPDELWQVVPHMETIAVDKMNVDHKPQFCSRITNVYYHYQKFSRKWYQGGDLMQHGHALPYLVSRDIYFESHPEWFALVNGKRDPYAATWWQYCYTNKEFAAEVAKKVIERFDNNPDLTQYPITANDGWETDWCECPACSGMGNDSDEMLYFANNVAKIVGKKYPDKKLTILSYHSTYHAPKSGIKAEPNIDIMFCCESSMTVPLDLNLVIPSGYNAITHNTYTQSWLENFKDYIKKADVKNISIWEWLCLSNAKPVWEEIPWVQGNVATRDQALWKKHGAQYVYYNHGPLPAFYEWEDSFALRWPLWYVVSKGMWDGSLTGEQILQDACNKLYGNAANEMFKYYQALAVSSEQCRSSNSVAWIPPNPSEVYTHERINAIDNAVSAARKKLGSVTDDQKKRIDNQIQYWIKTKTLLPYN